MTRAPLPTVAVVGAGAWGTTVASLLAARTDVVLWAREDEVVASITDHHRNDLYLPDRPLDPGLSATGSLEDALNGAAAVLLAVPAQHLRTVLSRVPGSISPTTPVLNLAKGIEEGSGLRMTEVVAQVLPDHRRDLIGALSGPNIAGQVLDGLPAATVVAVADPATAEVLQATLMSPTLRVYTNPDVVGCEVGGAVKNIIALAAGMAMGLDLGENALAAVVTRGLAEMTRLGVALGADALTFLGLAGIGDLMVTCHSRSSRNHQVGTRLGQGEDLARILGSMRSVAEGVRSCEPVLALARRHGVELPICEQVAEVLAGRQVAQEVLPALFDRRAVAELHDLSAEPPP